MPLLALMLNAGALTVGGFILLIDLFTIWVQKVTRP